MSIFRALRRNRNARREKAIDEHKRAIASMNDSAKRFTAALEGLDATCRAAGVSDEERLRMLSEVVAIAAKGIINNG